MKNEFASKLKKAAALLIALLLLACVPAGCKKKQEDLPVVTEDPFALQTFDPSAQSETALPTQEASAPTEEPTAAPTAEPTAAPTAAPTAVPTAAPTPAPTACPVSEDGQYSSKDEVALYIHLFGHLPSNFITKKDANALGWTGGSLEPYAPGCSIGGDRFGNYEGILPNASGRKYYECDIDTRGARSRGAKRIVFSNDGLIYYTGDHYEHFTLLYGGD